MKKLMLLIFAFGVWTTGIQAQNDVYYIPSKKVNEVKVTKPSVTTVEHTYTEDNNYVGSQRNVDEYNRRGTSTDVPDTDYDNSQNLKSSVDESDAYSYTKMIVRFHSPVSGVIVSSPYYWDLCYGDTWDVYYDSWALSLPSWSYWTYAYDPWYYNRWYYRTCWDYTWGWYDPYWGAGYWGWHRPAYWGWNRPCYGSWGYAYHHPGSWGGHYAPGFGHTHVGGGRSFASDVQSVRRGSAGGRIIQGGTNYRSMGNSERNFSSNNGALSKGFRVDGSNSRNNGTIRSNTNGNYRTTGGGGFTRGQVSNQSSNRGTITNSRSSSYQQSNIPNRSMGTTQSTPSRSQSSTPTVTRQQTTPSRGGSVSSGSMSRGGGVSSGGGVSRGGGGGFSRGGGGRR